MAVNPHTCFVAPFLLITPDLLDRTMGEVIEQHEEFIAGLNRQQLNAGLRSDNSDIEPDYTPATVQIKQAKGQPSDKVRLFDEGNFYDSIFVDVFDTAFQMGATDGKTSALQAKYGDKILGLSPENKQTLINTLRPHFIQRLRAAIGL